MVFVSRDNWICFFDDDISYDSKINMAQALKMIIK